MTHQDPRYQQVTYHQQPIYYVKAAAPISTTSVIAFVLSLIGLGVTVVGFASNDGATALGLLGLSIIVMMFALPMGHAARGETRKGGKGGDGIVTASLTLGYLVLLAAAGTIATVAAV